MKLKYSVNISLFSDPIKQQLQNQGIDIDDKDAELIDRLIKSWNVLRINSILTESETNRAGDRIFKKIKSIVKSNVEE